ncbi:MAG: hypothetical protein HC822_09465 [Oscillochloris sp.]|nr:hypothetical protein [Oscillochloris sp.]
MQSDDETMHPDRRERLTSALRRVVLLKETGPKSAAWHRARVQTIWRLHKLLDSRDPDQDNDAGAVNSPAGS